MASNNFQLQILLVLVWLTSGCDSGPTSMPFDRFHQQVNIDPWQFRFLVEPYEHPKEGMDSVTGDYYLKVTVSITNARHQTSLLQSISSDLSSYEAHYRYLSFNAGQDLFIQCSDHLIYPIGYVFEPSLGLGASDRLVYTFSVPRITYEHFRSCQQVSYWYMERGAGLGSICFTPNHHLQ